MDPRRAPDRSRNVVVALAVVVAGRPDTSARTDPHHGTKGGIRTDIHGRALRDDGFSISWQDRLAVEEERRMLLSSVHDAVALRVQVDHNFAGQKLATVLDRTLELP